jgi:hypothetical protein
MWFALREEMTVVLPYEHEVSSMTQHEIASLQRRDCHGPVAYATVRVNAFTWGLNAGVDFNDDDLGAGFYTTEDVVVTSVSVDRQEIAALVNEGVDVTPINARALTPNVRIVRPITIALQIAIVVRFNEQSRHGPDVALNYVGRVGAEAPIVPADFYAMKDADAALLAFEQSPFFAILRAGVVLCVFV